jgi:hypothetical protein
LRRRASRRGFGPRYSPARGSRLKLVATRGIATEGYEPNRLHLARLLRLGRERRGEECDATGHERTALDYSIT